MITPPVSPWQKLEQLPDMYPSSEAVFAILQLVNALGNTHWDTLHQYNYDTSRPSHFSQRVTLKGIPQTEANLAQATLNILL